jgi:hypothetical protein
MVANFAGKGRVFSFYAPYRCDYCDADRRVLLQTDRDHEAIKSMKPPERPCQGCGNPEYFDEDPTSFFSFLAAQPKFELDPQVASFLASKLNYAVSDAARRLRVEKHIEGRSVYLKLAGDLDGSFPREKLAEGMEGTLVLDVTGVGKIDPAGAAEWRGFLAMVTPPCDRIYLLGCPPVFLERLTRAEDLGQKAQVLSFAMPYSCAKCATTSSQLIDVEAHFDVLKLATPPEMKCVDCKGATTCAASENLLSHLPTLPKVQVEPALRKFIKEIQERKPEKPQVATTVAEAAAAGRRSNWIVLLTAVAAAVVVAVGVVLFMNWQKQKEAAKKRAARDAVGAMVSSAEGEAPAWALADQRFAASCIEAAGGFECMGVSSYADTQDEAKAEASEAALDELAQVLASKLSADKAEAIRRESTDARNRAISDWLAAKDASDNLAYDRAKQAMRAGQGGVAKLVASSGVFTPNPETWWAEFEPVYGTGSRWLVHARFVVTAAQLAQLVERYERAVTAEGISVLTVFPSLAWRHAGLERGVLVIAGVPGIQPGVVITTVNDKQVKDAGDFQAKVAAGIEAVKKTDCEGVAAAFLPMQGLDVQQVYRLKVACPPKPKVVDTGPRPPTNNDGGGSTKVGTGVNVWQKTGGGEGGRDNPDD